MDLAALKFSQKTSVGVSPKEGVPPYRDYPAWGFILGSPNCDNYHVMFSNRRFFLQPDIVFFMGFAPSGLLLGNGYRG